MQEVQETGDRSFGKECSGKDDERSLAGVRLHFQNSSTGKLKHRAQDNIAGPIIGGRQHVSYRTAKSLRST